MRIANLTGRNSRIYSCNVYLIRGDWNAIEDVNTLVDVGSDPSVIDKIKATPTGVGKKAVDQVILTHGHSDHAGLLPAIREVFDPVVYAYSTSLGADVILTDGQLLRCGDRTFQVIHTPGHSNDSICLCCGEEGVLFVGDTPVIIRSTNGSHEAGFVQALGRLCRSDVRTIYFGHGDPVTEQASKHLRASLQNVRKALMDRDADECTCPTSLAITPAITIERDASLARISRYDWFNIATNGTRVGKMRVGLGKGRLVIYSVIIFSQFVRQGYGREVVRALKQEYREILADRVRDTAKGFWRKMGFRADGKGNYAWQSEPG